MDLSLLSFLLSWNAYFLLKREIEKMKTRRQHGSGTGMLTLCVFERDISIEANKQGKLNTGNQYYIDTDVKCSNCPKVSSTTNLY